MDLALQGQVQSDYWLEPEAVVGKGLAGPGVPLENHSGDRQRCSLREGLGAVILVDSLGDRAD